MHIAHPIVDRDGGAEKEEGGQIMPTERRRRVRREFGNHLDHTSIKCYEALVRVLVKVSES